MHVIPPAFVALLALALPTLPLQAAAPGMQVDAAWARRAPMLEGSDAKSGTGNSAVYAILVNRGSKPDALIAAASNDAGAVEVHQSYQESGMMMMRPIEKIDIPAGASLEMKPGGYHLMLLNLKRALEPGQTVRMTLSFREAGKIAVTAPVR